VPPTRRYFTEADRIDDEASYEVDSVAGTLYRVNAAVDP
jgi:hypothetical protein